MEIRIGILNAPRELSFESSQSADEVLDAVGTALDDKATFVRLTDNKGSVYVVPTATIGYVEVGSEQAHPVGFVA